MNNPTDREAMLYLLREMKAQLDRQDEQLARSEAKSDRLETKTDKNTAKLNGLQAAMDTVVKEQIEQGLRQTRHAARLRAVRSHIHTNGNLEEEALEDTSPNLRIEDARRATEMARELKLKFEAKEREDRALEKEKQKEEREDLKKWSLQKWIWFVAAVFILYTSACSSGSALGVWYLNKHSANEGLNTSPRTSCDASAGACDDAWSLTQSLSLGARGRP